MLFFPTVDEDFQYFRSQGYSGSLNDMHYKAMGDLGYTGSLNDRIHAFLTFKYGSFYEAMRDLRNGTSVFSLISAYAVNNFDPSLVFDFEQNYYRTGGTETTLNPAVTHTRASSATMTNSSGNIVTVGNNVARVGHHIYNGSAWVNEGVLHESEARTNLLTYSQDFTHSSWTKANTATLALDAIGPDGVVNSAVTLVDSNAGGTGYVRIDSSNITTTVGTAHTASIYAKADQLQYLDIRTINWTTPANASTFFNLSTGVVVSTGAGMTSTIENAGNGWYRCSITFTTDSVDAAGIIRFTPSADGTTTTVDLDGTSSILIYGAQLEAASTPSSYIPTSGSTVTRAAETLTVPAANLPWPTPVVIGDELITNGTFDSNTNDWTASNSTLSVDSNRLKVTATGSFGHAEQDFTTVSGKVYSFTANYIAGDVDGYVQLEDQNGGGTIYSDFSNRYQTDKTVSVFFTAVSNETRIALYNRYGSAGNFNFWDNISVKEINPLSVSIQMDGRMTGENLTPIRWLEDANNAILLESGTNNFTFTQEASGTVDTVTGGSFTSGTFVTFNTSSRHGSTFINGAIDGTALTANTTPVALPDLSTTDLELGYDFMGTIGKLRVWSDDLTDTGIEEAST